MLMSQVWKLARRSKVCERLEDLQEDVLRQVLGLVVPPDELVGEVEHLAPVLADDGLPGDLVPGRHRSMSRSGVEEGEGGTVTADIGSVGGPNGGVG